VESRWDSQATTAIVDDLYSHQYLLTREMLRHGSDADDVQDIVAKCCAGRQASYLATSQLIHEIRQSGSVDLAMLAVANRQLRALAAR
jgi:glutamate dehydrogenase